MQADLSWRTRRQWEENPRRRDDTTTRRVGNTARRNNVATWRDECLAWRDDKTTRRNEHFFPRFDAIVTVEDLAIVDWEIWADSIVDTCTNPYKPTKYARNGRTRDVFEIWKNEKFASITIRNLSGFSRKLFFLIIEYCEHENCRNRTSQVNKYELLHTYETKHTFLAFFSSEPGGHTHLHLHLSFSGKLVSPFLQGFGELKTFKKKAVQYLC